MGIETPADLSGSECSFTSAIIAVEELAKVDASVAVMVDVHNTLVNTVLRLYGSDAIKEKWLPGLATNKVSPSFTIRIILPHLAYLNCLEW
jgi:short/branched chain acyl-CoA dehydrogenase